MEDQPLEGRPWVVKIPHDKPWEWTEVNFWNNSIEIQTHFIHNSNCHPMRDTTGETNLAANKFPRMEILTYSDVEWISKSVWTLN